MRVKILSNLVRSTLRDLPDLGRPGLPKAIQICKKSCAHFSYKNIFIISLKAHYHDCKVPSV